MQAVQLVHDNDPAVGAIWVAVAGAPQAVVVRLLLGGRRVDGGRRDVRGSTPLLVVVSGERCTSNLI